MCDGGIKGRAIKCRYSPICFYILMMQTSSMDFKNKDRKLDQSFNSIFCYIDDVLSLSNSRFGNYLHHIDAMSLKLRILLILKSLLLTLTFTLIKLANNGAQIVPIGIPIVCWKTRPPNRANMLSIKKSNI
jgi:hypothetical protein